MAANERLGGATMGRNSQVTAARLNQAAAKGNYLAGLGQARIMRHSGKQGVKAGATGAGGTLLSGAGSAGQFGAVYFKKPYKAS